MLGLRLRIALAVGVLLPLTGSAPPTVRVVVPNDNRVPAGHLRNDTLTLRLVVARARWFPQDPAGPSIVVPALAEEGHAPAVPGPMIRVPVGTHLVVELRNALVDSTIWVRGLGEHPITDTASVPIRPGDSRTFRFDAGTAGSYIYAAVPGMLDPDSAEQQQVAGAFIVDSAARHAPDRVFVMNIWSENIDRPPGARNTLTINGRTWPWVAPEDVVVGDTVQWRVLNASERNHPMHMHGMYFRVDARGDGNADTILADGMRRLVVTENMVPWSTMRITWAAEHPGNWLFHCHLAFHVSPENVIDSSAVPAAAQHMVGLVLGIRARERIATKLPPPERLVHLYVDQAPARGRSPVAMGYVASEGAVPPSDSVSIPGTPLILTRGQPTSVMVVNRLDEPTSVHWHGLELDQSYSDGVTGWSGQGRELAHPIAPGDSFNARLTLARAGTFIYHTHLHDIRQLAAGLYGPLIVLEPGEQFDPATDHIFVAGWDGQDTPVRILINGDSATSPPLVLAAGRRHRLRFINMGLAVKVDFALKGAEGPVQWQALAKDGADLPGTLATLRPAVQRLSAGETADFRFTPSGPGAYQLVASSPDGGEFYRRALIVR